MISFCLLHLLATNSLSLQNYHTGKMILVLSQTERMKLAILVPYEDWKATMSDSEWVKG